jgi:hypothetical protein
MTEDKKYCPINPDVDQSISCVEGKCAWWDEDAQACAVLVLARTSKKVITHAK